MILAYSWQEYILEGPPYALFIPIEMLNFLTQKL